MKITVFNLGKTKESYLKEGIAIYEKRIKHYVSFEMIYLNDQQFNKNLQGNVQKGNECKIILFN